MQLTLGNPIGAFTTTTTFVSGVDAEGQPHEYGNFYLLLRANATVRKGHGVEWVNPTATVPASVTPMAAASLDTDFAGVAMDSGSAGSVIRVCISGFVLVWANAQVVSAGQVVLNPTVTAGELITAADPLHDATLVSGTLLGRVFGIKDPVTNLALCFIRPF